MWTAQEAQAKCPCTTHRDGTSRVRSTRGAPRLASGAAPAAADTTLGISARLCQDTYPRHEQPHTSGAQRRLLVGDCTCSSCYGSLTF